MRKLSWIFAWVFASMFLSTVCLAASPWTEETTYVDKTIGKFEFGFKNLAGGWTELVTEPMDYHKEGKCALKGLGKGICHTITNTVGGALHLGTFFIPVDIPLPHNGVDF